jgi:hypothetical protein
VHWLNLALEYLRLLAQSVRRALKANIMLNFITARRRHAMFAQAINDFGDEAQAASIWLGVVGTGQGGDDYSQAVADTTPTMLSTLVASDDIAAAFATSLHMKMLKSLPKQPQTPPDCRMVAHAAWKEFLDILSGEREHDTGGDDSWALPFLKKPDDEKVDNAKLREIAVMAGRMYSMLRGAKTNRVKDIPEEVVGVELGCNITGLTPDEYALWIAGMGPQADLLLRLSENRATQWETEGYDVKGRGPIVIALDESGSMDGQPDTWAKAAMTALTRIAWEDRRPVKVVHFSTATRVHDLNPGASSMLRKAQLTFLDGGTHIGVALQAAAEEVVEWASFGVRNADVVLISDGGDRAPAGSLEKAVDAMLGTGARLFSVAIGTHFDGVLKDKASEYVYLDGRDMRSAKAAMVVSKVVN